MKKTERCLALLTAFCLLLCAIVSTGLADGADPLLEGTLTVTPSFSTIYVLDDTFAALKMDPTEFGNRTQRRIETEVRVSELVPDEYVADWDVSDLDVTALRNGTNKCTLIAMRPGTVTVTAVTNKGRSGSAEVEVKSLESFAIDQTHFPDDAFRDYLLYEFGDNIVGDNLISRDRIESLTKFLGYSNGSGGYVWFHNLKCSSLQGIEYFSNLEELKLNSSNLTGLDVSQNKKLKVLQVNDNELTSLNVNGCDSLEVLWCRNNLLTGLDVTGCPNLYVLDCFGNQLTSLDVTQCPRLKALYATYNKLSSLNISQCPDLLDLYVDDTNIGILDITACDALWNAVLNGTKTGSSTSNYRYELATTGGYDTVSGAHYNYQYNVLTYPGSATLKRGIILIKPVAETEDPPADPPAEQPGDDPTVIAVIEEPQIIVPVPMKPDPDTDEQVTLKSIKISKLTPFLDKIKVEWNKLSSKDRKTIKKIQIQVSTDKKFKKIVSDKTVKSRKTSFLVSGLEKGKRYYVRIRALTKVGSISYVSKWSAKKGAKTLKK